MERRRNSNKGEETEAGLSGEEFDYERDLSIDPHFLDAEFLNHPSVFMKYAKESARANKEVSLAEERLQNIRSQLIMDANDNPEKYLGEGVKPTVAVVEAFYREHQKHRAAKKEVVEAQYYANLLQNALTAFQARKSALENLVKLYGMEYFSAPREPRELADSVRKLDELKNRSTNEKSRRMLNRKEND